MGLVMGSLGTMGLVALGSYGIIGLVTLGSQGTIGLVALEYRAQWVGGFGHNGVGGFGVSAL